MRPVESAQPPERSIRNLWPLALVLGGAALRFGPKIHSWASVGAAGLDVLFAVGLLLMVLVPCTLWRRHVARRLARKTGGRAWPVSAGRSDRYLVLTADTLGLVNGRNRGITLPLERIVEMTIGPVPIGTADIRWWKGLIVSFGYVGEMHVVFEVGFVRRIGILTSTREAEEARDLIQGARTIKSRPLNLG